MAERAARVLRVCCACAACALAVLSMCPCVHVSLLYMRLQDVLRRYVLPVRSGMCIDNMTAADDARSYRVPSLDAILSRRTLSQRL